MQITGILAIFGALIYAVGDVLLLAAKVNLDEYPKLQPYTKLLSDSEKMVVIPHNRLMQGALIGVFATPLMLAGHWQVFLGLEGGNEIMKLITFLLFAMASIIGAFVHGSFFYLGEYIHALNEVDDSSQPVIAEMIARHKKVLIIAYAPLLIFIFIASILFSMMVGTGSTLLPVWMAAINPVTLTIVWLVIKRVLSKFITDATEGAGFNIAFFAFFLMTTITLWNS